MCCCGNTSQYCSLPEPLLACCVPELQFDPNAWLHFQEVHVEVHPYCLVDAVQKHLVCVTLQQGRLDDPELVLPQSGP